MTRPHTIAEFEFELPLSDDFDVGASLISRIEWEFTAGSGDFASHRRYVVMTNSRHDQPIYTDCSRELILTV